MTRLPRPWLAALTALAITAVPLASPQADQQATPQQPMPRLRSGIDLVFVNVIVRDRDGAPVRGLSEDDFTITEDGRRQKIATFYFEDVAATERAAEQTVAAPVPVLGQVAKPAAGMVGEPIKTDLHGRRLIVLFFDLTAMQPEEVGRAAAAVRDYVETRLSSSRRSRSSTSAAA